MTKIAYGIWRLNNITSMEIYHNLVEMKKLGIDIIDTADIYHDFEKDSYGQSERMIGQALSIDPNLKKHFKVITKCGIVAGKTTPDLPYYNNTFSHIVQSVYNSLINLQVEQIDTLLLHRPDLFSNFNDIYLAFRYLKEKNLVKNFGVSNYTPIQFEALNKYLQKRDLSLVTNQIEMNNFTTEHLDNENIFYLKGSEITPMIWSPMAGGKVFTEDNQLTRDLKLIADLHKTTLSSLVIACLNHQGFEDLVIILGSHKMKNYHDAIAGLKISLEPKTVYQILKLLTKENVK